MSKTSKITVKLTLSEHGNPAITPDVAVWVDKNKDNDFDNDRVTMTRDELSWSGSLELFDEIELHGVEIVVKIRADPPAKWKLLVKGGDKDVWKSEGTVMGTVTQTRVVF